MDQANVPSTEETVCESTFCQARVTQLYTKRDCVTGDEYEPSSTTLSREVRVVGTVREIRTEVCCLLPPSTEPTRYTAPSSAAAIAEMGSPKEVPLLRVTESGAYSA